MSNVAHATTNPQPHLRTARCVLLCSGKRLEEVEPLEITVKLLWPSADSDVTGRPVYAIAGLEADGQCSIIGQGAAPYVSLWAARFAAWHYAALWIDQGLTVIYRSDLED